MTDTTTGRRAGSGSAPVIQARGLTKRYRKVVALDGVDLDVDAGTVLGLLGPNGAGKTTIVRILSTLLEADEGTAVVAGINVRDDPREVRRQIGLSGQYAAVDEYLTGFENLDMIGRLYHLGRQQSRRRSRELLEQFDLAGAGDRPTRTYSGGMRRRLDLAGALVAHPPVLFLDEPTTGLDPRGRIQMWDVIRSLVAGGTTLLLTTQYLEEADMLADEIVVIDHGKAIARGTADQLKLQVGGERLEVTIRDRARLADAEQLMARLGTNPQADLERRTFAVSADHGVGSLAAALRAFEEAGIDLDDVGLRRPTLDDAFLRLTGRAAEELDGAGDAEGEVDR